MKQRLLFAGLLLTLLSFTQDVFDGIVNSLKNSDAKHLSSYFSTSLDLTLLEKEEVYGKSQAELMLRDFFTKHTTKSFEVVHRGRSQEGTEYAIGHLIDTNNKEYRISFYIRSNDGKAFINELRIEAD